MQMRSSLAFPSGRGRNPMSPRMRAGCRAKIESECWRLSYPHPALGAWNPERAVAPISPESSTFRVEMYDGDVPAFKAIVVAEDGVVTWSPAADRVVFLRPDRDMSMVELDWGPAKASKKQ